MNSEQSFGQYLKQCRKALDLTQEALAHCVGCSVVTLRKIEAEARRPSTQIAERLADCLDIPPRQRPAFVQYARVGPRTYQLAPLPRSVSPAYLHTPHHSRSNLPAQSTSLIGREQDMAAVRNYLVAEGVRLLTLTGPPGVGKTRLALQVAAELIDQFEDGVFFVPLAPISDPDLVVVTIAQTLGILETEGQTPLEGLKRFLQEKWLLLLLDNFEQVVPAASHLADLLAACPRLKILVTSRATLHMRGEQIFAVQPLTVPRQPLPVEALQREPAVAVFIKYVRAAQPKFALTRKNAPAVTAICARLDGLPLAIELVASHCRMLPPEILLDRLADGHPPLQMLTGGPRDLPLRQQTLREAIGWSYALLEPNEKILFARLAVFVDRFSLEAADAICNVARDLPIDILDGIASLLDKSLLLATTGEQETGEVRLMMLETIRAYALEQLKASGEMDDLQRAHTAYYLALAETAAPHLIRAEQIQWLNRLEREHNNLRAALRWALNSRDVLTAMRLSAALWRFWFVHGHLTEGRKWLQDVLSKGSEAPAALRAEVLKGAGILARNQADYVQAKALLEESLALYRALDGQLGMGSASNNLGLVALNQSDFERAALLFEQSRALFREAGDRRGIAFANFNLGMVALHQGDVKQAKLLYDESLSLFRELGDKNGIALSLNSLGLAALDQGDLEHARAFFKESLTLMQELGDRGAMTGVLEGLARLAEAHGQFVRIASLLGAVEVLREVIGAPLPSANYRYHDQAIAAARAQLDETTFAAIWAQGREMTLDQAIASALANGVESKTDLAKR